MRLIGALASVFSAMAAISRINARASQSSGQPRVADAAGQPFQALGRTAALLDTRPVLFQGTHNVRLTAVKV